MQNHNKGIYVQRSKLTDGNKLVLQIIIGATAYTLCIYNIYWDQFYRREIWLFIFDTIF